MRAPKDSNCPHLSRTDSNCDRTINVLDVVYLIAYVFRGGPKPCDPCAL